MRKKIVAGNWKMNKTFEEAEELLFGLSAELQLNPPQDVEVIVFPPALYLELANDIGIESNISTGVQNISEHESGAYTGEISAAMISSAAASYVILGHSERRSYYGETDKVVAKKIDQAIKYGISPVYCCGEVLSEREADKHFEVVKKQLSEALFHLDGEDFTKVIVAYEPVWAIGTGRTATPAQAQEMHAFIRGILAEKFGKEAAENTSILYGGSCNAENAAELFANPDVDGGLIGGASLKAVDFVKIANSF